MKLSTLLLLGALAAPAAVAQTTAPAPAPAAATPAAGPFDGTWTYAFETPNGVLSGTFRFTTTGDTLRGTMSNPMGPGESPLANLVRDGQTLTFSMDSEYGTISYRLVFAGSAYTGALGVMGMSMPIAGARKTD